MSERPSAGVRLVSVVVPVYGSEDILPHTYDRLHTVHALVLWSVYWIAFYLILGVSSSYWGQHTLPVSLMGLGLLLCTLDQIGPRLELRGELGWSPAQASSAA